MTAQQKLQGTKQPVALPGSLPTQGENRPRPQVPVPWHLDTSPLVRLYRITSRCICYPGRHTLWSHLLNSHRDSGQVVGQPDTSPQVELPLLWV